MQIHKTTISKIDTRAVDTGYAPPIKMTFVETPDGFQFSLRHGDKVGDAIRYFETPQGAIRRAT